MAKPKIFVSSTYYDLKYIRASLDQFIRSLGYESILSEKGNIAYIYDRPLDESCYKSVLDADIFVIIVGGRYGAEKSESRNNIDKNFYDRYDSITKMELKTSIDNNIPTYILIEKSVYSDYENFLRNRTNGKYEYAHTDSVNIFFLIENVMQLPNNNPILTFTKYDEIEDWLKEQWAGLFRFLIRNNSNQIHIKTLSNEIETLSEITKTLKNYSESILKSIAPGRKSEQIIEQENEKIEEANKRSAIGKTMYGRALSDLWGISIEKIIEITENSATLDQMIEGFVKESREPERLAEAFRNAREFDLSEASKRQLSNLRKALGLPIFD